MEEKLDVKEEEIEDDPREYPRATIARIDVIPNPFSLKRQARMSTGGKVPRINLDARSPYSHTTNPFHTLLHSHQLENCPKELLPSSWDMDRSYGTGKGSFGPEVEEKWGDGSKNWDSFRPPQEPS